MKILVAGDFYPRRRTRDLIKKNDYSFLDEVRQHTSAVNYSLVNFECCVADDDDSPIDKCGPCLKCDKKAIETIKYAGFNGVTLANNHFYDYGDNGVVKTINACKEYGLDYVGGGMSLDEASKVLYKRIGSETLAVVNFCENEFSIAADNHGGSAPLDLPNNYRVIREARNMADFVLIIVHGGIEEYHYPTPRMKDTYRFFIEVGADAVVNHHQHCISGYEVYKEKPIFYGLGNFCFDWVTANVRWWEEGYIVELNFDKQKTDYQIIPYIQFAEEPKVSFDVLHEDFFTKIDAINKVIDNDELLKKELEKKALQENKLLRFEPYNRRITQALYRRHILPSFMNQEKLKNLLNMVRCESHYDILLTTLLNKNKQ